MIIDELCRLRSMAAQRIDLERRIEFLESMTQRTTANFGGEKVQSSGGDWSDKVVELLEAKLKLEQHKADIELLLFKIEDYINELPPRHMEIIRLHYVDGLPWKTVAARTYRTVDSCFKLHRQALKIMKDRERNENV